MRWKKVTLIGVGLLGGSLGLALKWRRLAGKVVGFVRRAASVDECKRSGAVDEATLDLEEAVRGADLVVFCTPLAQMKTLALQMLPALAPDALVTDVGSVKAGVVRELERVLARAGAGFVGSHPMAGSEKTGVRAARADLFAGAACVVTPTKRSSKTDVRRVERLWESVGGRILRMTPEMHDKLVSRSSHLPHLLAAQMSNFVLDPLHPKEQAMLCATGFRDTTRIASGSPEMWRDIALANRKNLSGASGALARRLRQFQRALKNGDAAAILKFYQTAKNRRDEWSRRAEPVEQANRVAS